MSAEKLAQFQAQFAKRQNLIHLNNAGLAPISLAARDKLMYWSERFYQEGFFTDKDYMNDVYSARQSLASLIGCHPQEIAWYQSTAGAINQFAFGIGLQADDEVVMWDQEYSSHLYPWKAACDEAKAKLVIVKSEDLMATPTEKYIEAFTEKTKVAAFSWVQFSSGAQMDIEPLIAECKKRGILVFVDIAQGLGIHPCNIWHMGADAVVGASHKWLASPVGVGYLAIRNEITVNMKPRSVGAYTYGTCDDPSDFACMPKRDASKFEPGSKQVLEITALGASCAMIKSIGVEVIESEALKRAHQLRVGLETLGFQLLNPFGLMPISPMVNFLPHKADQMDAVAEKLSKYNISYAKRGGGIRLSTHAFTTDAEIKRVLHYLSLN